MVYSQLLIAVEFLVYFQLLIAVEFLVYFQLLIAVEFLVYFQLLIAVEFLVYFQLLYHSSRVFSFLLPLKLTVLNLIHFCVFSSECSTLR
jgi:hypothetical protein